MRAAYCGPIIDIHTYIYVTMYLYTSYIDLAPVPKHGLVILI